MAKELCDTSSRFYGNGANLKALEFRIIFHAPAHRLLSSAHIDNYIHYSGAKSFVDNGRCESFLKSNET